MDTTVRRPLQYRIAAERGKVPAVTRLDWGKANMQEMVAVRGGECASLDLPRPKARTGPTTPAPAATPQSLVRAMTELRRELVDQMERGRRQGWHPSRVRKIAVKLDKLDDMLLAARLAELEAKVTPRSSCPQVLIPMASIPSPSGSWSILDPSDVAPAPLMALVHGTGRSQSSISIRSGWRAFSFPSWSRSAFADSVRP